MNHAMRRSKQLLPEEESYQIIRQGTEGVLSLVDPEGMPYGIPLNYVIDGNTLFFHCAKQGRKLDCIANNPNASFCVIDAADIIPEEFTTYFRDAIIFGKIRIVEDEKERINALRKLGLKYYNNIEACDKEISKGLSHCLVLAMDIEEISGKEAIELVNARKKKD